MASQSASFRVTPPCRPGRGRTSVRAPAEAPAHAPVAGLVGLDVESGDRLRGVAEIADPRGAEVGDQRRGPVERVRRGERMAGGKGLRLGRYERVELVDRGEPPSAAPADLDLRAIEDRVEV